MAATVTAVTPQRNTDGGPFNTLEGKRSLEHNVLRECGLPALDNVGTHKMEVSPFASNHSPSLKEARRQQFFRDE